MRRVDCRASLHRQGGSCFEREHADAVFGVLPAFEDGLSRTGSAVGLESTLATRAEPVQPGIANSQIDTWPKMCEFIQGGSASDNVSIHLSG